MSTDHIIWSSNMFPRKTDLRSLDFVIDLLFIKLFRNNNMDTVRQCQQFLDFDLPSVTVVDRAATFES